jgi:hypothetical protein
LIRLAGWQGVNAAIFGPAPLFHASGLGARVPAITDYVKMARL